MGCRRSARQICIDAGLIRRGDAELPERAAAGSVSGGVVPLLRHLLRLSCGTTSAARRTETDERFSELVARLHDKLVVGVDAGAVRAAERCRDGTSAAVTSSISTVFRVASP